MEKFLDKYLFTAAGRDRVVQIIEYITIPGGLILSALVLIAKFL